MVGGARRSCARGLGTGGGGPSAARDAGRGDSGQQRRPQAPGGPGGPVPRGVTPRVQVAAQLGNGRGAQAGEGLGWLTPEGGGEGGREGRTGGGALTKPAAQFPAGGDSGAAGWGPRQRGVRAGQGPARPPGSDSGKCCLGATRWPHLAGGVPARGPSGTSWHPPLPRVLGRAANFPKPQLLLSRNRRSNCARRGP